MTHSRNRSTIITLAKILLLGTAAVGSQTQAATINASNCSQSAVQNAIDSARNGDTVVVPSGTCTWSRSVSITDKSVTVRGSGSGSGGTRINHGGGDYPLVSINGASDKGKVEVSDFWFFGSSSSWNGTALQLSGPNGWKNVRIHHNKFEDNYPWTMSVSVSTYGLIDNNVFAGQAFGIKTYGRGKTDWSSQLTLGTDDFFFIESNTFDMDDWYGATGTPAVDMFSGGRVVFRHNTGRNYYFGTHDRARSGLVSANAYEIYNNTSRADSNKWKAADITAGTGVIWGNEFTGDWSFGVGAMDYKTADPRGIPKCNGNDPADQNAPGQSGWRCQYQIGSQGEGANATGYPLYVWNNRTNGAVKGMECTAGCEHVRAGRDFINNGTTPKPGYKAFVYPHPLAGEGASKPRSPANVRVE